MSAKCQKQTLRGGLFDNLIRFGGEIWRDLDAKRLSGLEVDDRLKFARLNHRDRHFAWQQSLGSNVRFGSKADIGVECAPDGGQVQAAVLTDCWAWWSSYCTGLM